MPNSLSVSVRTRIDAPVDKVWHLLTDFGSYHSWHPILTLESPGGRVAVGTLLEGKSSGGPAGEQPVAFTIALVEEPNLLAWNGGDPEKLAGRHSFQLQQLADGTTEFIESEVFTGPAAPEVIGGQLPALHAAYETFAAAFKKRVEEGSTASQPDTSGVAGNAPPSCATPTSPEPRLWPAPQPGSAAPGSGRLASVATGANGRARC